MEQNRHIQWTLLTAAAWAIAVFLDEESMSEFGKHDNPILFILAILSTLITISAWIEFYHGDDEDSQDNIHS